MAGIGDHDLVGLRSQPAKADRRGARRRIRHRQTFAPRRLLGGGRSDQRAHHGKGDSDGSQHGKSPSPLTPATVSPNSASVMAAIMLFRREVPKAGTAWYRS